MQALHTKNEQYVHTRKQIYHTSKHRHHQLKMQSKKNKTKIGNIQVINTTYIQDANNTKTT